MRTETDEELMNLYIQGDIKAFDALYLRHKAMVFGYLVKKLPSKQQAEEVFQMAFLKLHQSRSQYNVGEAFLPWLFTIARNSLFDHLRKTRSEAQKIEAYGNERSTVSTNDNNLLEDRLEEGINQLSNDQKALITQRYVDGLDFEEIAKRSNSNPAAVRQSVSRVTRKLKSLLKGSS